MNSEQLELKKLYVKAKRRGMIELDLVLGFIADNYLTTMNKTELDIFTELLNTDDDILYKWLMGKEEVPLKFNNIWNIIKQYKLSR
ncbi:succinate dehydrogenase assembly factor 2 [Rickettsiales bacterium LUAb2]